MIITSIIRTNIIICNLSEVTNIPHKKRQQKRLVLKDNTSNELSILFELLHYCCLPLLKAIFNNSLSNGTFSSEFKSALNRPLLKRLNFDTDELKNYGPVSNSRQFVGEAELEKRKTEICDTKADWSVSSGICVDEH